MNKFSIEELGLCKEIDQVPRLATLEHKLYRLYALKFGVEIIEEDGKPVGFRESILTSEEAKSAARKDIDEIIDLINKKYDDLINELVRSGIILRYTDYTKEYDF